MDRSLTYKEHITEQLNKTYAKVAALRRIRRFVPLDTMIKLYKIFVVPHFDYCSPLLIGIGKGQWNRMEDANYHIITS